MSFTSKGTHEILVAGCQAQMYKIDVGKGVIVSTVGHIFLRPLLRTLIIF